MEASFNNINIHDINLSMSSNAGDNFMSFIYRAVISFSDGTSELPKTVSLIVKSIPTEGDRAYMLEYDLLNREVDIYTKALAPMLERLKDDSKFAPKLFYATTDPVWTIVFEDMNRNSFFKETYNSCGFSPDQIDSPQLEPFFHRNLKRGAEIVADMPGLEQFSPILMRLYENFKTMAMECVKYEDNNLNVLNHGDLWVTNIMFKYDPEVVNIPTDAIFIDYQQCHVNSLALDLNYFFVINSQIDVLQRKEEFMQRFYYPTFKQVLENINFRNIPTLKDILTEMRNREMFSLFNLFGELPLLLVESSVSTDYGSFSDEALASETRNAGMAKPRFLDTMTYVLKFCEEHGFFNF